MFDRKASAESNNGLSSPFQWSPASGNNQTGGYDTEHLYEAEDILEGIHPIFTIPWQAVDDTHTFFRSRLGF